MSSEFLESLVIDMILINKNLDVSWSIDQLLSLLEYLTWDSYKPGSHVFEPLISKVQIPMVAHMPIEDSI